MLMIMYFAKLEVDRFDAMPSQSRKMLCERREIKNTYRQFNRDNKKKFQMKEQLRTSLSQIVKKK